MTQLDVFSLVVDVLIIILISFGLLAVWRLGELRRALTELRTDLTALREKLQFATQEAQEALDTSGASDASAEGVEGFSVDLTASPEALQRFVAQRKPLPAFPSFGKPVLVEYDPDQFEAPLACCSCGNVLQRRQQYFEIPLPDQGEGALLAVCWPCHEKEIR